MEVLFWGPDRSAGCARCRRGAGRSLATVVAAIIDWTRETGVPPVAREWMLGTGKWGAEYPLADVAPGPRGIRIVGCRDRCGRASEAASLAAGAAHRRIDASQDWADTHGRPPRSQEWRDAAPDGSHPSRRPVSATFGSWNAFLAAVGLPIAQRSWSADEILAALAAWNAEHGRPPAASQWMRTDPEGSHPSTSWVLACLGSWSAALEIRRTAVRPGRRNVDRDMRDEP